MWTRRLLQQSESQQLANRRGRRWLSIIVALALGVAASSCSGSGESATSTSAPSSTSVITPDTSVTPPDTSPATTVPSETEGFRSNGELRDGWYWLEHETTTARWEFVDLQPSSTEVGFEVRAVVPVSSVSAEGTGTFTMSFGSGDNTVGTREVTLAAGPAADNSDVALLGGSVNIATSELVGNSLRAPAAEPPSTIPTLWVEFSAAPSRSLGVRAESLQARSGLTTDLVAAPVLAPPSVAAPPLTRVDGMFTSNGDLISGWRWLRDTALRHYARWEFASIPTLTSGVTVQLNVLATDAVNGGPFVDARFYLTYGFYLADQPQDIPGEGKFVPPPPTTVPQVSSDATTQLLVVPNVSPSDDPLGYTAQSTIRITASDVPERAVGMWFEATRDDPSGVGTPTVEHVAFNASSLGVIIGGVDGMNDDATTGATGDNTIGDSGSLGTQDGLLDDPDGLADADTTADADAVGDLPPGTYHGTLDGETEDWFAFQLDATQIVDIQVAPAGNLLVDIELFDSSGNRRAPHPEQELDLAFSHAAGRGEGGRYYLHLYRLSGSGNYTFTIDVRDPDDALRGLDAGDTASTAMTVGSGDLTGEVTRADQGDFYAIDVPAGKTLTVSAISLSGKTFDVELREPNGSLIDSELAYADEPSALFAGATGQARAITISVKRYDAGIGGRYRLRLLLSGVGECSTDAVSAVAFASSGAPDGLILGTQEGVSAKQPGWFWLRSQYVTEDDNGNPVVHPIGMPSQSAGWTFDALPDDPIVRVLFDLPIDATAPTAASAYVTYGVITSDGARAVGATRLVTLRIEGRSGTLTGFAGVGELDIPHADLAGADSGWWVRLSVVDPTRTNTSGHGPVGLGVAITSATLCPAATSASLTGFDGPLQPATAAVTYDGTTHTLESDISMFVDPATDVDGDGLNQSWEDAAIQLANPVIQLDEEELWLHWRSDLLTANFVEATLWPSYANPQYVVLGYLNTWSYDPGGGALQLTNWQTQENHRGDSERIWEAWRIVDDQHVQLEWVNTSAHANKTNHSAVWNVNDRQCNVGYVASVAADLSSDWGFFEVMCDTLRFDGDGRLVMSSSENKHAMYPSNALCNDVSIGALQDGTSVYGENCGWDTINDPFGIWWSDDDFNGDPRYQGGGRWIFDAFNVGEPGYPLIDDLDQPSSWIGLTDQQVQVLAAAYPAEAVWSGRDHVTDGPGPDFCGGLEAGDVLELTFNDIVVPSHCSEVLGSKFRRWQDIFLNAMASTYRMTLQTGTVDGAGTDQAVIIELRDANGTLLGAKSYEGDLENGATDIVYLGAGPNGGGDVSTVSIRRSGLTDGRLPDWYLASVTVDNLVTGASTSYAVDQWIVHGAGISLS